MGLLAYQSFLLHRFCGLCVGVDVAAVVAGVAGSNWILSTRGWPNLGDPLEGWAHLVIGLGVVTLTLVWPQVRPVPAPSQLLKKLSVPGRLTIVEISDPQCPFCREFQPRLSRVLKDYQQQVALVRLHGVGGGLSRDASKAILCAEKAGRGEAMADRLFAAPRLNKEVIAASLAALDSTGQSFSDCLGHPSTEQRLRRDRAWVKKLRHTGLPTTYVAGERIDGAASEAVLRHTIRRALMPAWLRTLLTVGILGLFVTGIGWVIHRGRRPTQPLLTPTVGTADPPARPGAARS